jgi:hypothetical protein
MDARKLIGAIESAGYEARSYSGRGMRGKECVGVEIPQDESAFALAAKLILAVFDEDGDEEAYNLTSDLADLRISEEAMGLDAIVYFPRVPFPQDRTEEDEEACEGPARCTPSFGT